MKKMFLGLALGASVLLGGCATHQTGQDFDTSKVEQIETGETTKAQIEQWFGQPQGTGMSSVNGERLEQYTYNYSEGNVKASSYIPVIGWFVGGTEASSKTLTVYFGEEDKVYQHHMAENQHDTSMM